MITLQQQFAQQHFPNEYQLVNGVEMHAERGWGEDFWVRVVERDGSWLVGTVDNPLVEARLHELHQGDSVYFHEDYILAVHGSHREEIVLGMDAVDLKTLAQWLGEQKK